MIRYTDGLRQRWTDAQTSLPTFLEQQSSRWGAPSFSRFERLYATDTCLLYLDYDVYLEEEPTQDDHDHHLSMCRKKLEAMFADVQAFDPLRDVKVGHSHGWVADKKKHKISLRFWLPTFQIIMGHVPALIARAGQEDWWDVGVYHSQQKLRIPGACKGEGDYRVLELEDRADAPLCLAQNVQPGSTCLSELLGLAATPDTKAHARNAKAQGGKRPRDETHADGAGDPFDWDEAREALEDFGFRNPVHRGARQESITFSSDDKGHPCPLGCGRTHDSNNNFVLRKDDGSFWAKSYSPLCKGRTMGQESALAREVMTQVLVPLSQTQHKLQAILSKHVGGSVMEQSVELKDYGFDFRTEAPPACLLCGRDDCGRHYQCRTIISPCCDVIPYDTQCSSRMVGWEEAAIIQNLIRYPNKDVSFVEMFRLHQEQKGIHWVWDGTRWYKFAGVIWEPVTVNDVTQSMQRVIPPILITLINNFGRAQTEASMTHTSETKRLRRESSHILAKLQIANGYIQKVSGIDSIVATANRNLLYDSGFAKRLDQDKSLCGCPSGIIDLETGALSQGDKDLFVSKSLGAAYRGLDHPTPDVDDFFHSIFNGDQAVIEYMQRFLGYCLTGHTKEQVFAIFHGAGSNGKGILNQMLAATLGDYYCSMHRDCLFNVDRRGFKNQASPHLAELQGRRLGVTDESSTDDVLDCALVKAVTGQSAINCRFMRENNIAFTPTHKPVLMTNARPRISVEDTALLRRLIIVPFANVYKHPEEFDANDPTHRPIELGLGDRLTSRECQEQFVTWLVRGAVAWHAQSLGEKPAPLQAAQRGYVEENDTLTAFIRESCDVHASLRAPARDFREAYQEFIESKIGAMEFKKSMDSRGFKYSTQAPQKGEKVAKVYLGLRLKG